MEPPEFNEPAEDNDRIAAGRNHFPAQEHKAAWVRYRRPQPTELSNQWNFKSVMERGVIYTVTRLRYKCPSPYRRIGNRCYFFSEDRLSWHESGFACHDLGGGYLAKLDKNWKDRKLKSYLKRKSAHHERWIGGIYDDRRHKWIWAMGGEPLRYQGFSRRRPHDNYRWRCIVMNPSLLFRWSTRSCILKKNYICEIPIHLMENGNIIRKNLRRRKHRLNEHRSKYHRQLETNQIL